MQHLLCFYCERGIALREAGITQPPKGRVAHVTIHDRRGCRQVCWAHANWRGRNSVAGGHSSDCAVMVAMWLDRSGPL